MNVHTYAGDYKSAIARAKRVLSKAGFAWSRTTGRYAPFDNQQVTTSGVKVTRVGCSDAIALHVHDPIDSQAYTVAGSLRRRDTERRAIEALRAGGLPFDDRGWLECNVPATKKLPTPVRTAPSPYLIDILKEK